jgi:hypothetical protein
LIIVTSSALKIPPDDPPKEAMEIKEGDIETSFISVQFTHQGISDEQTTHQEKCVNCNCAVENAVQLPL